MDDLSQFRSRPGVDGVHSWCRPTDSHGSSALGAATGGRDGAPVVSFAVITVRNDTTSPITFDVRALPGFPRFLTFRLPPGQERAFYSRFRPGDDSPGFQVEYLRSPGRAHTHTAQTLTEFNVKKTEPLGRIDHADGRLYVFRPTGSARGLFAAFPTP